MCLPPIRLMNEEARTGYSGAGRTVGLICASIISDGVLLSYFFFKLLKGGHFRNSLDFRAASALDD